MESTVKLATTTAARVQQGPLQLALLAPQTYL
jgi:hypothetical protein